MVIFHSYVSLPEGNSTAVALCPFYFSIDFPITFHSFQWSGAVAMDPDWLRSRVRVLRRKAERTEPHRLELVFGGFRLEEGVIQMDGFRMAGGTPKDHGDFPWKCSEINMGTPAYNPVIDDYI